MDLVGGDGDQVRTEGLGGEGNFQKALHRIGVEDGVGAETTQVSTADSTISAKTMVKVCGMRFISSPIEKAKIRKNFKTTK